MSRLELRQTWVTDQSPPPSQKPIKSKYVFKIKVNRDNTLKYKVRLCACGYSQKYGIDYDETFAPTAKYKSLCTVLTIAASNNWTISGIDVENAFVEADIDRPLWMNLPKGTYQNQDNSPVTVKLLKSLYGLKQAPELWDKFLVNAIKKQNFKQLMHDQCIFIKTDTNGDTIILVKYVDDIIITGNNSQLVQKVIIWQLYFNACNIHNVIVDVGKVAREYIIRNINYRCQSIYYVSYTNLSSIIQFDAL